MWKVGALMLLLGLGGCASSIEAWKGRPWGSHAFRSNRIYVASADRRIVLTGTMNGRTVACPELSPEVAASRGASSSTALTLKETQTLSLADAITVAQMKGHELDSSSQKYAMLHWSLCTAFLNGAISPETYQIELLKLVAAGTAAMLAQSAPKPAGAAPAPPAPEQKKEAGTK